MGNSRPVQSFQSSFKSYLQPCVIASLLFSFSIPAQAQSENPGDAVVVTASRLDQQLTDTIAHTTVITDKDIRESHAVDLPSLLKREAGFEFSQNGGIGSVSSIFMRGASGNQVLVLIDGVRVSSATAGTTAVENVMLDQIERVEIVRGNVSALYGEGAIGGVIQIFTKQGHGVPAADAQVMAGSRNTDRASAGYSGSVDNTRLSLNVSHFETRGFPAINTQQAPNANPNNDGYNNRSLSGQIAQTLATGNDIGLRAYQSEGTVQYANAFGATTTEINNVKNTQSNLALYSNNRFASFWNSRLTLAQGEDKSRNFTGGDLAAQISDSTSRFDTTNRQVYWQNDFTLSKANVITAGMERQEQRVDSDTSYTNTSRTVNSMNLAYNGRMGDNQFQLSKRHDRYSDFGDADTWLAGYGYDFTPSWKMTSMRSTAFRAPTFNDLYYPGFGNPNLRPERTQSNEVGLQYVAEGQLVRLAAFHTEYRDLILILPAPPFLPENIGDARVKGAELSYTGQFRGWNVRGAFTSQNPVDATTGAQLRRRSKTFGNLVVNARIDRWRVGPELVASGPRPDNDIFTGAPVMLPGYAAVNLIASYLIQKNLSVSARLENIFDKRYQLAEGYNTAGRGMFVSLNWRQ